MNMKRRQRHSRKVPEPPGRVRIVAGKWRGRFVTVADVPGLRPTPERIRETLFNWLAPRIEGSRCFDLFAGTGVLGLEALSRGAAAVTFIERSAAAVRALRESVTGLRADGAAIREGDAWEVLRGRGEATCDIAFLDPPYADERLGEACALLAENGWLAPKAVVYYEQLRGREPPALPEGWRVLRENTAGNVRYCLLEAGGTA